MNDNMNFKKEKSLGSNRLYSSYLIDNNNQKAVLKVFNENLDIPSLARILDDFIICDPLNSLEGYAKIIKFHINEKTRHKFFIREFMEGETLKDIIDKGRLSVSKIIDMGIDVAEKLHKLEELSLYHSSLNPKNIIISPGGEIIILDSFMNKVRFPDMNKYSDLDTFDLCFTAPEFFIKESNLDILSDVYSLGCILIYCATGLLPFNSEDREQLMRNHIWGSVNIEGIPHDNTFLSIISPDRASRPQSMKELKILLENLKPGKKEQPLKAENINAEQLNHTLIFELLKATLLNEDIKIVINQTDTFSHIYIKENFIKYIETHRITDSFLYYLINRGIFPNTVIDELFPYINNKIELINHITTLDMAQREEIEKCYQNYIEDKIVNEILHLPNSFESQPIDNEISLPSLSGLSSSSALKSIFCQYQDSIMLNHNIYTEPLLDYDLKLAGLQETAGSITLNSFEVGVLSSITSTPNFKQLSGINPSQSQNIEKAVIKGLFLGLIFLYEKDIESNTDGTSNGNSHVSSKKTPNIGSLRHMVDKDDAPMVNIIRPKVEYLKKSEVTQAEEEIPSHVRAEIIQKTDMQQGNGKNQADHRIINSPAASKEQKTVIAASLLQEAKDYYGNIMFSRADESISEALKVAPSNPVLLHWKAKISERIPSEFDNAKNIYEKALSKEPDNPEIIEDFCIYLCKAGNKRQALELIKRLPQTQRRKELEENIQKESRGFFNRLFQK